ncbi:MAG: Asp-tRNA(Asn)/Glu-tRNA(Gln) amidotransferase GatCAB subunit B, partial [candidate division Zixibacteria bacterium]|nr:Asp-tRNA(Asn)/Glu-tRNA(Gln) amidotransferase GatCAB subunit B [candidate division Zixibacteria bacterium]NIW39378.1 Asp-tRNA(Asn)/Glu-tRNA(Gln) amidotransferase GatCAB subunit B [candidate division Zixibacteria bacterium]NIX58627.1 Asp-tRNA(Asn)/Glu-tRNA(Gln) amidotransferase GatCAB subunit B [candidate division Zixibacteria bacterium]
QKRFIEQYQIREYDAEVITSDKALSQYYEDVVRQTGNPRLAANWIMGEVLRVLKERDMTIQ